ncbi:hypothetical protein AC579_2550 [Pseudocercospora musae]|uniref:Uncharacterized protein n=1 Tax=Pseudocercospora musae TaxID=113226 RepID=A0A139I2W4_9PEZI|nr:hypothetical protein AC579_2550 [Pseudocercospora musae]
MRLKLNFSRIISKSFRVGASSSRKLPNIECHLSQDFFLLKHGDSNTTSPHFPPNPPNPQTLPTPPLFSTLSPDSSYRLQTTLADFLPSGPNPPPLTLPPTHDSSELPPAHHLLYFEPTKRSSEMLPDGTNPDHFPGEPFGRRMWAGGKVVWNHDKSLRLDGGVGVCCEFIRDVTTKGEKEGDEKVFVEIERRIAKASHEEMEAAAWHDLEHRVRQRLWRDGGEDLGPASILERRTLVFLRRRSRWSRNAEEKSASKLLENSRTPDYTHTLTPDPKLLFRFSALTFNAHAIHLDPLYCRDVEGHRNILVHGPLSLTFMITLLSQHLAKEGNQVIRSIEYRNTAPLYCGEEIKFCGKRTGERKWEVWAEGPDGGIAVKGRVKTEEGRIDKSDLGV